MGAGKKSKIWENGVTLRSRGGGATKIRPKFIPFWVLLWSRKEEEEEEEESDLSRPTQKRVSTQARQSGKKKMAASEEEKSPFSVASSSFGGETRVCAHDFSFPPFFPHHTGGGDASISETRFF